MQLIQTLPRVSICLLFVNAGLKFGGRTSFLKMETEKLTF